MGSLDWITTKIAKLLGESHDMGVDIQDDVPSFKEMLGLYPLSALLPYQSFDPETQLFYNKKSVGFMVEVSPLSGANEETVNVLHTLITDNLPSGAILQFLLWASPKVEGALGHFQSLRSGREEIFERLAQSRVDYLSKGTQDSLFTDTPYLIRDFRLIISVSIESSKKLNGDSKQKEVLLSARNHILGSFKSLNALATVLDADSGLTFLSDFINSDNTLYSSDITWNPHESIARQVVDQEMDLEVTPTHLSFNGGQKDIRSFSVKKFPDKWAQWLMSDLIGDLYRDMLRIPCPFAFSLSVRKIDKEASERKSFLKGTRAAQLATSPLARFMPRAAKISADWKLVGNSLDEDDCLVQMMFQVLLFSKAGKGDQIENSVKHLFNSKGWKIHKDRFLQFPSWLSALPMTSSEGLWEDMRFFNRVQTKLGFNAVNLAPLQGEWKGTSTPRLLLSGRRGQVLWWDPFDNQEGNYNVAVTGKSGSGKSVFMQELLTGVVGSGGRVFVIDIGRSFEKLCGLLGGEFIEFTQERLLNINPFTHINDFKESLSMLKPMTALMAAPTRRTTDFENAVIEKALRSAWQAHGQETTYTYVAEHLLNEGDKRAHDLGMMLFPYTKDGMYSQFFEGRCTLDFNNPLIVLELEELKSKKDLQSVILCLLMYHVTEAMYRGDRKQHIACIIDEAWDLLRGEMGGEFMETGCRRARKYEGAFITGTQSINDYYKSPAAQAAFDNSDWLCLLAQKPESIAQLKKSDRLMLDEHLIHLLNSLKTRQGEYSEILIQGVGGFAIGRLLLDPFTRVLYSSKGSEYAAVKTLQEQGLSVTEAIERIAQQIF